MTQQMRLKDCSIFNKLDACRVFLETFDTINQPMNYKLSSYLQLACKYSSNPDIVKALLLEGSNPYYLDINGLNAYDYLHLNENKEIQDEFKAILDKYGDTLHKEDKWEREELVERLIQEEIRRQKLIYPFKQDRQYITELLRGIDTEVKYYGD